MARPLVERVKALRAQLAARPDTEHEQAIVRLVNTAAFGIYLLPDFRPHEMLWVIYLVYLLAGTALLADIFLHPAVSPARRMLGALADVAMLTWALIQFGEGGAPLFLVFLWITLANGFRFGANYLVLTLVLSAIGFGAVLAFSEFWMAHRTLGIGLLIGLVALSLYVRKLVTQLFDALARAEAANQAKRRFISVVSHELRTPLNAIIGMADLLRDTPMTREQADMLQTLRGSSRVMLGLVDDVLDFSKIEAGKLVLARSDFDLHALINSTCRILSAQAIAKGVEFVVSLMPEVPPAVRGDPHALRQVLINLAGNSVKFTDKGSVTLHVTTQAETPGTVRLKFSIRDTGIGIAPEAQKRIFESFTQADESTSRRFGGTGLGTTIARQLVTLMGGQIGLESAVGLGSTFWFEITLEKQPERAGAAAGELDGARVLLVGLPPAQVQVMEQVLTGWGAVAVCAPDVEQALARMVQEISLAQPFHSALLWSDGDLKLLQRFRRGAPNPAPPIVLAVPRDADVSRFDALSAGFSAVIEIPFEKRQLFNVLHSVSAGDEVREGVIRLQDYAHRGGGGRKLRLLVADDNPTNREVLGKILERGGHAATLVADGDEALDAVERESYDVVILDRNMPGTDGLAALQALRLMTRGRPRLPVIVLSADATPEAKREAFEAGADAFLSKPIEALRLLDEVRSVANLPQAQGARPAERAAAALPRGESASDPQALNLETVGYLEELGSSPAFVKKLAGVFVADNGELLGRMERAVAARNYAEFRAHVHAMKGSSASMGTDRLTRLCTTLGAHTDAEIRLRGAQLVRSLAEELESAREALERYVEEKQRSAS